MIASSIQLRVCPLRLLHSVKDGTTIIMFFHGITKPVNLVIIDTISQPVSLISWRKLAGPMIVTITIFNINHLILEH